MLRVLGSALLLHCTVAAPAKRWVSYWYSPAHTADDKEPSHNFTATLALLEKNGGTKVATSLMLYCEDIILADGSFQSGVSIGCDAMIPQLNTMGIGAERIVGSPSIDNLRAMFKSPAGSIAAMVAVRPPSTAQAPPPQHYS